VGTVNKEERHLTGSLQASHGKFYAVLNIRDKDGKPRQKWVNTDIPAIKGNKTEAMRRLHEILVEYGKANIIYSPEIGFADYLERWLEEIKPNIQLSTWETYEVELRRHIVPYFREHPCKLSKLAKPALQKYCNEKSESGNLRGKGGLAPKTIKNHHGIISKALQDAVNEGVIARNPAIAVKLPKIPQRILATYSEDEANALTAAAKGSDLYVPILLALRCGLRRGEILGLQWKSVDLKNGTIVIQDTMTKTQTVIVREGTKTESSYRKLLMPDVVTEALRAHKAEQEEHKAFLGTGYEDNGLVCAQANGNPVSFGFTKRVERLIVRTGLRVITFHDLRHTNATLLQDWGADIADISKWLGHSEISTTANIYLHLDYRSTEKLAALSNERLQT